MNRLSFITILFSFIFLLSVTKSFAQADDPTGTVPLLTSYASTCSSPTVGNLGAATDSHVAANACGGTPDDDVWYKFIAQGSYTTISLTNIGSGKNSLSKAGTVVEVFYSSSGSGSNLSYVTCGSTPAVANNTTSASLTINPSCLTVGTTYFIRIFSIASGLPSGGTTATSFNICITHAATTPPSNDNCMNATALTVGSTISGTVWNATASSGIPTGCASGTPDDDVWYKFVATSSSVNVDLSSLGADISSGGAMLQLFSGSCGALTSIVCGYTSLNATGLSVNNTYYIRVYSAASGCIGSKGPSGSTFSITVTNPPPVSQSSVGVGRMNEVFQQTTLSPANILNDPWEVLYGPDDYLWITEAKGYKVYRMNPNTGLKSIILDISQNSPFLPANDRTFNVQFSSAQNPWPQGGFAGMVLHPKFLDPVTPKNYVYVSYVHHFDSTSNTTNGGDYFKNRVVRFTYNTSTGLLESPVSLVDTLPGSSDHNSQRMIIAPVNGTYYLFYAQGDMGAGQFRNIYRTNNAQNTASCEGKILRFNLEPDNDAGTLDKWIPNDNPYNGTAQSAVWSIGIRNNQGFAYANINGVDYLYGSSHGPFSDDELNIIERGKNYGHPLVIGFNDGNYNNAKAGGSASSLPLIVSEATNVATIGAAYRDPIYSFYAAPAGNTTTTGTIQYIYNQFNSGNQANGAWPSEAPSGMDIYTNTIIPGWKNSLLIGALKGGKVIRLKLNSTGNGINTTVGNDTINYFRSVNRFRDVAISPDGKSIFTIIDKSSTTSGPTTGNPMVSACAGCVLKYTFLGYNSDANGKSTVPATIDITSGTANKCNSGTTITIDNTNNTLWVPITGPDGNIMAEIKANGNNLGTVTSSFYLNGGAVRQDALKRLYLDRNLTITPQNQPSTPVSIRLYITAGELAALKTAKNLQGNSSGVNSISDLSILKNSDACGATLTNTPLIITPVYAEAFGANGYVLQGNIASFSSFYFGNPNMTVLPLQLVYFKGSLRNNTPVLQWQTVHEHNTSRFNIERSLDGHQFNTIGTVAAAGNSTSIQNYSYTDYEVATASQIIFYYRLKMMDADGSSSYSKVITVAYDASPSTLSVYPNPIHDVLKVKLPLSKADHLKIQVTDINGRIIYAKSKLIGTGISEVEIDTKGWPSQLYLVKVTDSENKVLIAQSIVKQ